MIDDYRKSLERNIKLYYIFKVFSKRVYVPLIAIYLVNEAKLSVADIALITSITMVMLILLDIPTGYIADRWGRKRSVLIGTFVASLAPLAYLTFPNFVGGLTASLLFLGGWSFVTGAAQAFIHDTLRALNRAHEYASLMGRAQGYGLLGNVVLIAIIPLSWGIDHRLPFILGFFCTFFTFIIATLFTIPRVEQDAQKKRTSLFATFREIPLPDLFFLLTMYGIVSAVFDIAPQYRELVFAGLGIPTVYFGFILALGSIVAAITGRYIYLFTKMCSRTFYLFDAFFMLCVLVGIGLATNPLLSVIAFLFIPAYDRNRAIIAESHMLAKYPDHRNKATLLSVLDFYPRLNGIWIPIALTYVMRISGLQKGYAVFGAVLLPLLLILYILYRLTTRKEKENRLDKIEGLPERSVDRAFLKVHE